MDTDLSHEALERFAAIEARLDALEGEAGPVKFDVSEDEEEDQEEDQEAV